MKFSPINIESAYPQYSIPELGQWMGLCHITHFSITCQIMQIKDCLCLYVQPPCVLKCRVNKLPQISKPRIIQDKRPLSSQIVHSSRVQLLLQSLLPTTREMKRPVIYFSEELGPRFLPNPTTEGKQ